jgi:hypothetical protein
VTAKARWRRAARSAAGALLNLWSLTGATAALVVVKIIVAGLLAAAVLVRWGDLVA